MTHERILELLERVKAGKTSVEEAYEKLKDIPFEDLVHTKVDHHRLVRKGMQEVIFGEGKNIAQITDIIRAMQDTSLDVLVTRVSKETGRELSVIFPAGIYNNDARCFYIKEDLSIRGKGSILIVSAGTSDVPIAEEAYIASMFFGNKTERLYDVGVAGIHRLVQNIELLKEARVIIVVAGMEGALPFDCCRYGRDTGYWCAHKHRIRGKFRGADRPSCYAQLLFYNLCFQYRQWFWSSIFCNPDKSSMNILFIDPIFGISGDMMISAFWMQVCLSRSFMTC